MNDLEIVSIDTPNLGDRSYVIGRGSSAVVIDPQRDIDRVTDVLDARSWSLSHVLETHFHNDYVSGGLELARQTGAEYVVPDGMDIAFRALQANDKDELSADVGLLRVLHTPGHAPGHLVLRSHADGWTIAGDMVSTLSTIIVDPDDGGDMEAYVTQLRRMAALGPTRLLPAHGDPADDGVALLEAYVRHREGREAKILGAVAAGAETLDAVVARAYDDTPTFVWPIAARSALAHLRRLEARGAVAAFDGDAEERWKLRETRTP